MAINQQQVLVSRDAAFPACAVQYNPLPRRIQ